MGTTRTTSSSATECRSDRATPAGPTTLGLLLRPRWITATLLVAAFTAACIVILAPWQLDKGEAVDQRSELIDRAGREQPVPLESVQRAGTGLDPSDEWRQVTVRGSYLSGNEVLAPNRASATGAATHVLTPFRVTDSGRILLVNRGAIDPDAATTPAAPPAPPADETTITAQLRLAEETSRYSPPRVEGHTVVASAIDPARLSDATGLALDPYLLQLSAGQAGTLGELPTPGADSAVPHVLYGVQWLALGAAAPIALGVLAWTYIRREKQGHLLDPDQ